MFLIFAVKFAEEMPTVQAYTRRLKPTASGKFCAKSTLDWEQPFRKVVSSIASKKKVPSKKSCDGCSMCARPHPVQCNVEWRASVAELQVEQSRFGVRVDVFTLG